MPVDRYKDKNMVIRTHSPSACQGQTCALHNPSDHHMVGWPKVFRGLGPFEIKSKGFIERQCPHGIGHPDPDSLAYFESKGERGNGVHGCDGCCHPVFDKVVSQI